MTKFPLSAHIEIHVHGGVAQAQHGADVRRYIHPNAVIVPVHLVHVCGPEEDLRDGPRDGKQHETHGDGRQEHHGSPLPGAQQRRYFVFDPGGQMGGGVNPVAERDEAQGQTVKREYDREGDHVALQRLEPNQAVDEVRRGFVVVYAYGQVVFVDGGIRPVVRNSKEMAEEEDRYHCPCCTSLRAYFGLQYPCVDGYKTFHREHNHQPRRGVVSSVGKNVPQAAPRLVTPKGLPLVVLERKLNHHDGDQDEVVGHRDCHQVEGA